MGHNLRSCCHKCKKQIFHFRRQEDKTILPFYKKHKECIKENPSNVETCIDNIGIEPFWFDDETYIDDELQEK